MPTTTSSSQPRLFSSWSILWTSSGSKNRFWTETSRSRIHYPRRYSRRFKIPYKENLASARPDGPVIKVVSGVLSHPECPLLAHHLSKKCPAVLYRRGIFENCVSWANHLKTWNGDGARSAFWCCLSWEISILTMSKHSWTLWRFEMCPEIPGKQYGKTRQLSDLLICCWASSDRLTCHLEALAGRLCIYQ